MSSTIKTVRQVRTIPSSGGLISPLNRGIAKNMNRFFMLFGYTNLFMCIRGGRTAEFYAAWNTFKLHSFWTSWNPGTAHDKQDEIADEKIREQFKGTNLKRIRSSYGCTQAELAKRSGVSLRSIQMYEQRNKDINKASVETLYRISKVLGCTIEDLLEK